MRSITVCCALIAASVVGGSTAVRADEQGSQVVLQDEACPEGMVVTGLTGGEGDTSKVCVIPNSAEMTHDDTNVGDPDTASKENTGA